MKPRIRIAFADFWKTFSRDNYFTQLLARRFDVQVCDNPDYLFYSCFGKKHLDHAGIRIFYTGENVRPDFHTCDWAFTFDHSDHPAHYRMPLYGLKEPEKLIRAEGDVSATLTAKTGFCNFVYGNPKCRKRNNFFAKLSKYKQVDSGGRYLNNVGGPVKDKQDFIARYKFTIAFENTSYPGYTTEKIADPMKVHSLPIYWGNELVHLDFNPGSFVNYDDYGNDEALIDRIIELDRDDEKYLAQMREPCFHGNRINEFVDPENVLDRFEGIFASSKKPVAKTAKFHFLHRQKHRLVRNTTRVVRQAMRAMRNE